MTQALKVQELTLSAVRRILLCIGIIGTVLFSALFATTFANQATIERTAQSFIRYQIKKNFSEKMAPLEGLKYGDSLLALKDNLAGEIDLAQALIDSKLDEAIAKIVVPSCQVNCDERMRARKFFKGMMDVKLARAGMDFATVEGWIAGEYSRIIGALKRDLRIFLGTNAIMFAMVIIAMFFRRKLSLQLCIPAALLVLSAVVSIALYIFGQNWFHALLWSSFWGYAYSIYAGLIFAMLLDVILNQGRVLMMIIQGLHFYPFFRF